LWDLREMPSTLAGETNATGGRASAHADVHGADSATDRTDGFRPADTGNGVGARTFTLGRSKTMVGSIMRSAAADALAGEAGGANGVVLPLSVDVTSNSSSVAPSCVNTPAPSCTSTLPSRPESSVAPPESSVKLSRRLNAHPAPRDRSASSGHSASRAGTQPPRPSRAVSWASGSEDEVVALARIANAPHSRDTRANGASSSFGSARGVRIKPTIGCCCDCLPRRRGIDRSALTDAVGLFCIAS
jgi:hypothetical protein